MKLPKEITLADYFAEKDEKELCIKFIREFSRLNLSEEQLNALQTVSISDVFEARRLLKELEKKDRS